MSTHSCNNICNLDGGHEVQKLFCDDFSSEDMAKQLQRILPEKIQQYQDILNSL